MLPVLIYSAPRSPGRDGLCLKGRQPQPVRNGPLFLLSKVHHIKSHTHPCTWCIFVYRPYINTQPVLIEMALSSGGWAASPVPASSQALHGGGPSLVSCNTVLMSVRVSVCHSGIRPLCLPGAGNEALRLQLSMDPSRAGEFRLALRDTSGNRSVVSFLLFQFDFIYIALDHRYGLKGQAVCL